MSRTSEAGTGTVVTRGQIEAKLREISGEAAEVGEQVRQYAVIVGTAVVLAAVGLAFVLGKRKGRRKTTIVEVRRV